MNPTSPERRSPRYTLPSNPSPSSQREESEAASSLDPMQWKAEGACLFPVYSESENKQFKQIFYQHVKEISLQLQTMMACLSEHFTEPITSPWKALSALVSCLGNNLPSQIPLSIFTSSVAATCITNIEHPSPAKKSKLSGSSEKFNLQNKTLAAAQKLATAISSTITFVHVGVQLDQLKEKNSDSYQAHRAFRHAVSERLSVSHSITLDHSAQDLAERIVSVLDPHGDTCSMEAKDQLLKSAAREFLHRQKVLIRDVYTSLAFQKKPLPITGKHLLASCIQYVEHSASSIKVSANLECLPSWEEISFFFLVRTFLTKNNDISPPQEDMQWVLDKLNHYFPMPAQTSPLQRKQFYRNALTNFFFQHYAKKSSPKKTPSIDLSISYSAFLQCSSSIQNLLKGLFSLETNMIFSAQNLFCFQKYTQELHLPNEIIAMNALKEVSSICAEELQTIASCTKLMFDNTNKLLKQLVFQSLAMAVLRRKNLETCMPQDVVICKWIPDELLQSILVCNYWKEAMLVHSSGKLFSANLPRSVKKLTRMISDTSCQLERVFYTLLNKLLMDVCVEMPSEYSNPPLDQFFTTACTLKAKMLPENAPNWHLFTIVINFIVKSERLKPCSTLATLASQNFQESQRNFVTYTYTFLLKYEKFVPETTEALLEYCNKQYTGTMQIPSNLAQWPFWQNSIFLCLAKLFLQKKQAPMPLLDNVATAMRLIKAYLPKKILSASFPSTKQECFTQILAKELLSLYSEPVNTLESSLSVQNIYNASTHEQVLQSVASFKKTLETFFKLNTGQNFSPKNLRAFQKYTYELLAHVEDADTKEMLQKALTVYISETPLIDEPSKIEGFLANASLLLEKLLENALTILILRKQNYIYFSPQQAVTEAFLIISCDACVPECLLLSNESWMFWEKAIQTHSKKKPLSKLPDHFKTTVKIYRETALNLTQCFLHLCQQLLLDISIELSLKPEIKQFFQNQEQEFTATAYIICPKIVLEPPKKQSTFKELVNFLAAEKFQTNNTQLLTLTIKNFLKKQKSFVKHAYAHFLNHKLPLPLTGTDLLQCFKNQYSSTTSIPSSLTKLPSWNNVIFYTLARALMLKGGLKPVIGFHLLHPQMVINSIAHFFPTVAQQTRSLPIKQQIKELTKCLAKYFDCSKSLNIHDPDSQSTKIDPSVCNAYENFLQSAVLLKSFFKTLFTLNTCEESFSDNLSIFQKNTTNLLSNEPHVRRTSALTDVYIICSEDTQSLEQEELKDLWEDLNCANFLLQNLVELSLALTMLCTTTEEALTAQKIVTLALQIISSRKSLPLSLESLSTAFITSLSGTNALQKAMNAYVSGTLCLQLLEETHILQKPKVRPLQKIIDARMSGHALPEIAEYTDLLSAALLSKKEQLETLSKKLYINFKTHITDEISKKPLTDSPSDNFITTANTYHHAMISENHSAISLFQSLVFILAKEYEEGLQKRLPVASGPAITAAAISTTEETLEEVSDNIWKEIHDVLLEERFEDYLTETSQITTSPVTDIEEELSEELWPGIEDILSAGDFTDLLGTAEDLQEEFQLEVEDTKKESPS